jgi:hypothetical protein
MSRLVIKSASQLVLDSYKSIFYKDDLYSTIYQRFNQSKLKALQSLYSFEGLFEK